MKLLKTLCALTALASVFVGAIPQSGVCQVSQIQAVACHMPCCKTDGQTPTCPLIRPVAPRDVIDVSSLKVIPVVQIVAMVALRDFVESTNGPTRAVRLAPIARVLIYSTPQNSPAPPPFLA